MKICLLTAELFHVIRQTDEYDVANSRFFANYATAPENGCPNSVCRSHLPQLSTSFRYWLLHRTESTTNLIVLRNCK